MRFQSYAPAPIYVDSPELIRLCVEHCIQPDQFLGVDSETLGLLKDGVHRFNMNDEVVVLGLSPDDLTRYMVPRKHLHQVTEALSRPTPKALTYAKFDAHRIKNSCGVDLGGRWFDTVHGDYLVDEDTRENRHGLKDCALDYFGYAMGDYKEIFGKEDPRLIVPGHPKFEKYLDYGSLDPWVTRKLAIYLLKELEKIEIWAEDPKNGLPRYDYAQMYWEVDEPQIKCLYLMERRGLLVDKQKLEGLGVRLEDKMKELAYEINRLVGKPINPLSTQQMGQYFFHEMKYTPLSFTEKTKAPQVDEALFKHLALGKAQDPVAKLVMEFKECSKLNGTYVKGLLQFIHVDGRIHTSYSSTKTTGRLGSADPNLQNLPRPDTDAYGIRSTFVPDASKDHVFIISDYAQLEMVILADISGDKSMQEAIHQKMDMHSFTASKVLNLPYEVFTKAVKDKEKWAKEARTAFKKTGFGIVYGITKFALSEQLSQELGRYVSPEEAQGYINQYLDTFPGVRKYVSEMHSMARSLGYVTTICGRRRRLSKAKYGKRGERGHAERQAQNAPIQGSAADIVKRAMLKIESDDLLKDLGWFLLHQVHDELILEGPRKTAEQARIIVKDYMENAVDPPLSVPLRVDPNIAENYAEK